MTHELELELFVLMLELLLILLLELLLRLETLLVNIIRDEEEDEEELISCPLSNSATPPFMQEMHPKEKNAPFTLAFFVDLAIIAPQNLFQFPFIPIRLQN